MSYLSWYGEENENYKDKLEQLLKVSSPKEVINEISTRVRTRRRTNAIAQLSRQRE